MHLCARLTLSRHFANSRESPPKCKLKMKNYRGSCHCGAVRFEARIDLAAGTMRCNCSFCQKIRCWAVAVRPDDFHLIAGADAMSEYRFGAHKECHFFCRHCGVRPFGFGCSLRLGEFYGVSVACLDSVTAAELDAVPVTYIDGQSDNWTAAPSVYRFL